MLRGVKLKLDSCNDLFLRVYFVGENKPSLTEIKAGLIQGIFAKDIHSFIPDIYIAPLQETYSVQLRSKRNVLRSLQKEDMLF